jgi:hypothetical protein
MPPIYPAGRRQLAEVPLEEPRNLVDGFVGLVQRSELKLEDVRAYGDHLQPHLDVVPAGVRGQPDGVVQQNLMGADLDQQRGRPARAAKTGLTSGAERSPAGTYRPAYQPMAS